MRRAIARGVPGIAARSIASTSKRLPSAFTMPVSSASQNSRVAIRRLHATAQHLRPATAAEAPPLPSTKTAYPKSHEKIQEPQDTPYFIDNKFLKSEATQWIYLHDPATNNLVTRVPQSTDAELNAAVESAKKAFPAWKATSIISRQQIMFKFTQLIRENWDRLAASITLEQGKTVADAKGDVLRGLQVAEAACGAPQAMTGRLLEVAKDMETREYLEPLGVVAAICPFSMFLSTENSIRVPLTFIQTSPP